MKQVLKLIDGVRVKCRPLPQFTDKSVLDMPFIGELITTHTRAKNTLTHVFSVKKSNETCFIADCTAKFGKWSWYSAKTINMTPILQSNL